MMPPDESEEAELAAGTVSHITVPQRPASRPPPPRPMPAATPTPIPEEEEGPTEHSDATEPSPMPLPPPRPPPAPVPASGSAPKPVPLEELPSIELGRHESAPSFELPAAAPSTGEFCRKCGAAIYPTMIRCGRCGESFESKRHAGPTAAPSVRPRPKEARPKEKPRSNILLIGIIVSVLVAAGLGYLIYYFTHRPESGAMTADDAVKRFYDALIAGRLKDSVQYLRPGQQKHARETLVLLEEAKIPLAKVARRVIQAEGMSGVDFELGGKEVNDDKMGRVEVLFRRNGLPMRRTWMPVVRESGRWYVDSNPFVAAQR
jgi:hypothetical protein